MEANKNIRKRMNYANDRISMPMEFAIYLAKFGTLYIPGDFFISAFDS